MQGPVGHAFHRPRGRPSLPHTGGMVLEVLPAVDNTHFGVGIIIVSECKLLVGTYSVVKFCLKLVIFECNAFFPTSCLGQIYVRPR